MTHSVFTIVASIAPERVAELERALRIHPIDFPHFKQLHFASFVIFDRETSDPLLVFENNVDGSSGKYLEALMNHCEPVVDAIYENCVGYPAGKKRADKLHYLKSRVRKPHLYHVGAAYRTVDTIQKDRELRRKLDDRLDTLVAPSSARALWRQLQKAFPVSRRNEPWLLEFLKDFLLVLSSLLVVTPIVGYLWDRHWTLIGFLVVIYALKALWLLTLVGWWPFAGDYQRGGFVAHAAVAGAFIGLWAWHPKLPLLVGFLALVPRAATWAAGYVPAGNARQPGRNWLIVPLALLAAACSFLPVKIVLGVARWIGIGTPVWFDLLGTAAIAILIFVPFFVWLTFISAMPPTNRKLFKLRYDLLVTLGGGAALLFSAATKLSWHAPWPAAGVLAAVSLLGLIGLWDIALPSPNVQVGPIDRLKLNALEDQEDRHIQNHMSVMVRIKRPRRWRAALLKLFLCTLNRVFYRIWLPTKEKSTLFGIPTVHFAQWTVLDETRHMFLSNYDQSWGIYLDDFGAVLGQGLQKIWGQSEGNPGVSDIGKFKQFVRTAMVPHQVWYRAYPGLTSDQINNNRKIRLGLQKTAPDEETCARLLRRLSHIELS